ncbi:cache domain-containing sensor histidine kinase [Fredinandcohnia onubensis]|uniref:cache domain-containing sensor histidine kinase n=1 Tax=Fredinandcohnia onubensis TaxID=1571209 RepID=UPI000C0BFC90|nr:sensor histidine kinase [Fredinandcohnia onubensis]
MKILRWVSKNLQFKHVNHQIFVLMIVTITIPLVIMSVVTYIYSVKSVKNEFQNSSYLILNNLSFNIDQYLHSIEMGTLTAQMDQKLQDALIHWNNTEDKEALESIQYQNAIEHFMSTIEMTIKNVDSVQIFVNDRVFYSTSSRSVDYDIHTFSNKDWYKQTLERKGGIVLLGTHKPFHRKSSSESILSVARVINKKGTRQPLGVLLINIRSKSLSEILDLSESHDRNFVILDEKGELIYHSEDTQIELTKKNGSFLTIKENETGSFYTQIDGENSYLNFVTSPYSGWKVIQYIDEEKMTKQADLLRRITLGLALGSLVTALLFLYILYTRVTKPIIFLSEQVKLVGKGKFDVNLSSTRQDEFGVLFQGIRKMVSDIQNFIERSSVLKAQQKIAQYRALKSQINPHFLANALESIQMKAVLNKQRDISEMVGLLGRLFRSYIQTGKETVSLNEELNHTRLYVKVQQMRFGDKIQYVENLAPTSDSVKILHFSLQPLIENGIVHGLERKNGPGMLEVTTTFSGKELHIMVKDNGVGMDSNQLQEIRLRLSQPSNTLAEEHIGIKNVHDQIQYYFGNQYGIEIDSKLGEGTTVTMRVPSE